jgi:NAD(P)-dependent dehydrogenase (short-subunit alcohol dehydrogenase family)
MRPFDLSNQVAIVTGAFGKLGPLWSGALIDAGATVVALDRPAATPSPAFAALQARHDESRLVVLQGDVTDRRSLEDALDRCRARVGAPSVLVNNAGIDQPPGAVASQRLEEIPVDIARNIFEVNVLGAFQCTQVFGGEMVRAGRGSVINIGSLYASVSPDAHFYDHIPTDPPFLKPPAYGASKAALVNLTKYFATHWGPAGVRVNALSPGGVAGGQDPEFIRKFCARVPLGRMAELEDLVGPLVFLASDASAYVTGIELRVDGGFTAW